MKNIIELYFIVDEIVKKIEKQIEKNKFGRKNKLTKSELITLALVGHFDNISTDKKLYEFITTYLNKDFKNMPCYEQFTRGIRSISKYLDLMLEVLSQININNENDFYIIDSTALPVNGYNKDFVCPKWASDKAKLAKNIFGYYHGFKLHLVINRSLEVVSFRITDANVHDVNALSFQGFLNGIKGLMVGDKGYVCSQDLINQLRKNGLEFIFKQKENMDPYLNKVYEKILKQRQIIEGVFSYLKNRLGAIRKFAHSCESFLVHVKAALIAFMLRDLNKVALFLGL